MFPFQACLQEEKSVSAANGSHDSRQPQPQPLGESVGSELRLQQFVQYIGAHALHVHFVPIAVAMPRKINAIKFWREMSLPSLVRLSLAAFFLFSALGLVSILIESSIRVYDWRFVTFQAAASGGMAGSIVLFGRRRWWITLLVILFWNGILVLNGGGISFVYSGHEGMRVRLGGPLESYQPSPTPAPPAVFTPEQLDAVFVQRGIIGLAVIAFLVTGYVMFTSVIRGEVRRRARLESEVRIAQEIQQSLLPLTPFDLPVGAISGATLPAEEVGGDYYDIVPLPGGRVALAIADVTGHGVGAGILSAMTKSAFHLQLNHDVDPVSVLSQLNKVLYEVSDEKTFVTFAYALIDPASCTITVATAGHPPVLHRSEATRAVTPLRSRNVALGMRRDTSFSTPLSLRYGAGDLLLLYTDGFLEATDSTGQQFGERVPELLADAEGSPQEVLAALLDEMRKFSGRHDGFEDDVSLVCVRLKGGASA